ncbi:MAG: DUF4040 domain-containing protein [Microthrixaceae bacterium]|nr:DUF4040 domain-containing protein [Microthrixaceae bacterium]MCO5313177.1 DUF4040 domain-containing protein [Microthrixaceae bacterium]
MTALLALHLIGGLGIVVAGDRIGRRGFYLALAGPLAVLAWLGTQIGSILGDDAAAVTQHVEWVPALGLNIDLRLDAFAALMVLLVSGIGVLVFLYATRYFGDGAGVGRLCGLLVLFSGSMLGLVLADNVLFLYTCWELTAVTSFLLIGNNHTETAARAAALQAILTTALGGLAMLGGFIVIGNEAGTFRLSAILADVPTTTPAQIGLGLVLVGAATKSAQFPFQSWLPGAMAAPTPVSAYLHSATMVKAGVYLVARLSPAVLAVGWFRPTVIAVGLITMILGGLSALRPTDLKALLANGTISQLGFLFVIFGVGTDEAMLAGSLMLLSHGLFKAALFMGVGIIDHQAKTRDLAELPVLDGRWRPVRVFMSISAASMAGIPLAFGFVAKETVLEALTGSGIDGGWIVVAGVVVGSALTAAYSIRIIWGTFVWPSRRVAAEVAGGDGATRRAAPAPSAAFIAPACVLTAFTLVFGVAPGLLNTFAGSAQASLLLPTGRAAAHVVAHLSLWHGFTAALGLSALALGFSVVMVIYRRPIGRVIALGSKLPRGTTVYREILRTMNRSADLVTGVVQNGSLRIYTGVIVLTATLIPSIALILDGLEIDWPKWVGSPAQAVAAAHILTAAVAAVFVRRRFTAALFLGLVGYGMAALFIVQGAPDLALTQIAIETLTTVLFVLVLRRLPDGFERSHEVYSRTVRLVISAIVGSTVFVFALVAAGERLPEPVSEEMVEGALSDGHGRNIVNVILVDFRGFDTMGEITVLAAAGIGAVALARAGRRPGTAITTDADSAHQTQLHFDVSVSMIFYVMMAASVYLLFAGHQLPGGGFVGGLVAGGAIALRYVAGGIDEVRRVSPLKPWTILGAGVVMSAVTALIPLLVGDSVLDNGVAHVHVPVLGDYEVASAMAFDGGVYLVVIGLVLMVVEAFGERFVDGWDVL